MMMPYFRLITLLIIRIVTDYVRDNQEVHFHRFCRRNCRFSPEFSFAYRDVLECFLSHVDLKKKNPGHVLTYLSYVLLDWRRQFDFRLV